MRLLGVTGGVGMGKSTCAGFLRRKGIALVDTDDMARELTQAGQPALEEIRSVFGQGYFDEGGALRRRELGQLVFGDLAAREKLQNILHPRIRARWQEEAGKWRKANEEMGAVIIPLLFETSAQSLFDAIICVACSKKTQAERLTERGWDRAHIEERNAAQWPIEEKMARSGFVVWNEGSLETHERQVDKILAAARAGSG